MIVSKTRNAPGWATKEDNLIPIGVKCNENVIWVSVLRLDLAKIWYGYGIMFYIAWNWLKKPQLCKALTHKGYVYVYVWGSINIWGYLLYL